MNTTTIRHAVELALSANHLATYHTSTGHPERAGIWRYRRDQHMAAARRAMRQYKEA